MSHFEGKSALAHVIEKKEEIHGSEVPKSQAIAFDVAAESSFLLLLLWIVLHHPSLSVFCAVALGLITWKTARAGWMGWARLERLHRVIEQEKYEVEHHRPQEREELVALYSSKGFEGKLLQDVVDTLMADQDRLLKVMLEEEMGLTLEIHEHPLKQAAGAFLGSFLSSTILVLSYYFFPSFGIFVAAFLVIGLASFFYAKKEQNRLVDAVVWNLAIAALASGLVYFIV